MHALPNRPRLIVTPADAPDAVDNPAPAPADAPPHVVEPSPRKALRKSDERALIARLLESEAAPLMDMLIDAVRQAHEGPRLLSKARLAKQLDVSSRTIERMDARGLIPSPAVRRDQFVRWSMDTIARWIALGCPERDRFDEFERLRRAGRQPRTR